MVSDIYYAFALFLQGLDFTGFAIRGNFQGFQGAKKFLQKCRYKERKSFRKGVSKGKTLTR